jgi:hypothetical protein
MHSIGDSQIGPLFIRQIKMMMNLQIIHNFYTKEKTKISKYEHQKKCIKLIHIHF